MMDNRPYSSDELHAYMVDRERRRTTLLALLLVVMMCMTVVVYLIWNPPPKDQSQTTRTLEEGEPTEGEMGKADISFSRAFSPSPEAIETINATSAAFSSYVALRSLYEADVGELMETVERQMEELGMLYDFIDRLNEYLGGLSVITN